MSEARQVRHENHPAHAQPEPAERPHGTPNGEHAGPAGHDGHGEHTAPAAQRTLALESDTARRMAGAAANFLAFLSAEQRQRAVYPIDHDERFNWHYVPKERQGLSFDELDGAQQKLVHALISAGLSQRGYAKAVTIMSLEAVLAQIEGTQRRFPRDPNLYHVTIFGEPSDTKPWGWRVEGHHVSLNMLVVGGQHVAPTPNFFGANPARVPDGYGPAGLRVLAAEEDLARRLLTTLDEAQRRRAVIMPEAPADILTRAERRVQRDTPAGVRAGDLDASARHLLADLLDEYIHRMPHDVAGTRLERIEKEGRADIHFAWAGPAAPGQPHYYRLQGPTFLVEYDNTQNNANHIHSVWRDFAGDWGDDLLAEHYQQSRH
jgi:hypothetical protein